jgi:hypothetical protein
MTIYVCLAGSSCTPWQPAGGEGCSRHDKYGDLHGSLQPGHIFTSTSSCNLATFRSPHLQCCTPLQLLSAEPPCKALTEKELTVTPMAGVQRSAAAQWLAAALKCSCTRHQHQKLATLPPDAWNFSGNPWQPTSGNAALTRPMAVNAPMQAGPALSLCGLPHGGAYILPCCAMLPLPFIMLTSSFCQLLSISSLPLTSM